MVKNFLVVVIMEHVNGPNVVIVVNMNICPIALAQLNNNMFNITKGCLDKKPTANTPSPDTSKPEKIMIVILKKIKIIFSTYCLSNM